MSTKVTVDPPTLQSLAQAYTVLEKDAAAISTYLTSNCRLDDAIGFMLAWLKPMFDTARDHGFQAFADASKALQAAATQVSGALQDAEAAEDDIQQQLQQMQQEIDQLSQKLQQLESGSGSGGGGVGGGGGSSAGGGGGFSPVAPSGGGLSSTPPTTASPTTTPVTPSTPTPAGPTITISIDDRDTNVTVGDGNTGTVTVTGAGGEPSSGTGTGTTPVTLPAPGGTTTTDPAAATDPVSAIIAQFDPTHADPQLDQQLSDQLWTQIAQDDPLGRTVDQLKELWAGRDPIGITDPSASTLGYADGDPAGSTGGLPDLRLLIDIPRSGGLPTVQTVSAGVSGAAQ